MVADPALEERRRAFVESLTKEERVLVLVRDELYEGSWDDLLADLQARRRREPSIYRLNTRIDEDLERIAELRAFEAEHGADLRALLERLGAQEGMGS